MSHHNNYNMHFALVLILFSFIAIPSYNLSLKLTSIMDTTSLDRTILTYNTNIGDCSCDIHQLSCDVFCCCDSICSTSKILTWSTNDECLNTISTTTIERSCDNLSSGGFFSFQDLACVYYSNRGNISYFYQYPDSSSINYPTSNKFVAIAANSTNLATFMTTATTDAYSVKEFKLKSINGTTIKYVEVWAPVVGGGCEVGYLNISQSQTYSCSYTLNPTTCLSNTALFNTTTILCLSGNCSSTSSIPAITSSSTDNLTCFNMITSQQISLTISSSYSSYIIDSITIRLTQSNISLSNTNYQIKTTIIVTNPSTTVSYSGNPGYLMNKQVGMVSAAGVYKLRNVADAVGSCVTTATITTTTTIDLLFGQNIVYSCISSNPCGSSLYIDQIVKQTTLSFYKWAKGSNDTIQLSGTSATLNTCNQQTIVIDVLYTNAGWVADMQNYIVGAKISAQASTQSTWNRKYLKINWVFVDPTTISTPPTNYFYSYFSYLWKPLRDYFGVY